MKDEYSGSFGMSINDAIIFYDNLINTGKVKIPGPAMERLGQFKIAKRKGLKKIKQKEEVGK